MWMYSQLRLLFDGILSPCTGPSQGLHLRRTVQNIKNETVGPTSLRNGDKEIKHGVAGKQTYRPTIQTTIKILSVNNS
jgi:hypothetical protein